MSARVLPALLLLSVTASADSADPVPLRALFPEEAEVFVERSGLARIELPAEVLASCRRDLSNLRLFDAEGNEVPFLLDAPRRGTVREVERMEARVLDLRRGEEVREGRPNLRREAYQIAGPAREGSWDLVFESARPAFVAEVEVRTAGERRTGTLFRVETPRRTEKLRVPIGEIPGERLEVVIRHEQPFWIEPSMRFEAASTAEFGGSATIPLAILSETSGNGRTTVEVARPRGIVPEALRIETRTPTFDRAVKVQDAGPGRDPSALASDRVFRISADRAVEELELPLRPARGDRLRIVIDDGSSPPLEDAKFVAVFSRPTLVASLTAGKAGAPAAVLRFGGSKASAPRYDLEGLRVPPGREVYGRRAEALVRLYDAEAIVPARLGPVRSNPAYDPSPALAFASRAGAPLDTRLWETRRPLEIGASPDGLARVRLTPEDLARLRPDLADLRIADDVGRQRPYLVDLDAGAAEVRFAIESTETKGRETTYALRPAASPVRLDRLSIESDEAFFDRPFELTGETHEEKTIVLAKGRLSRPAGDPTPVSIDLDDASVRSLELQLENGDDAPLVLRAVRGTAPVPDVFVAAPPGKYWMLLGSVDARPPSYEIERAREVVLALGAAEGATGAFEENPAYRASARFTRGEGKEQALLWGAILAAVVVLAFLTLRLARRERV